ncbi:GspH/FimT family pseudopilin [Arenimonas composti]|uniref:Type II secretion system protein H n=1 Tax=Arenimonas composti TR7-09 = DSM 18010 TaxID=1121013 RepID=A0A091BEK5_9GAMM|nr:GspH/FimT family pseudopilin [Arenimonas composti]KFN51123.1 hypothetical protein P873_04285 [Arenimonas composti TR7-09 = DSM 18010]
MRDDDGFTLPELMVTVAVLGTLLAVALPAADELFEANAARGAVSDLTISLALARSEAVRRGVPVTVCPSRDGMRCNDDAIWDQGWITFVDAAKSGQPADPASIIRQAVPSPRVRVMATAGRQRVRFRGDGFSPGSNVTLAVCSRRREGLYARVIVNNGGRPRSEFAASPTPCPGT